MDARADLTALLECVDQPSAAVHADALIRAYGNVDAVLTASPERVAGIAGDHAGAVVEAFQRLTVSAARERVLGGTAVTAQ